jgi:TonB family protein
MKRVAGLVSLLLHAVAGVAVARAHARPVPPAPQVKVQVAVVEKPPPPPPPPAVVTPPPVVHVVRMARAAGRSLPPRQLDAPPPPTTEAAQVADEPVAIAGISYQSTSAAGSFAAAVGNTLAAAPDRVARNPAAARPYKAAQYAAASELAEAPQVLNRDQVDIRRYYPKEALQRGIEAEVILRLTIDSDGSIAEASVVRDPGEGLGAAALRAVREFRFAPGRVGATPVATAIPFVIRFVIS